MREIMGDSVLILGYGLEGRSVHRWLKRFYPKVKVGIADSSSTSLRGSRAKRGGRGNPNESFIGYDTIVKSPGIPPDLPALKIAVSVSKHITSVTNIFFSVCPGKIIAVTGTKGKSTTASLIAKILSEKYPDVRLVGNIGNPALDYLESSDRNTLFVIELSSYQLEDIRYGPFVAVILDIVPEHLDRYKNFKDYIAAKSRIVKFQTSKDYVIFNPKRKIPAKIASQSRAQKVPFRPDNYPVPGLAAIPVENRLAAMSAGEVFGVPLSAIRKAISSFKPLPHRLEKVGEFGGVTFYDDSISTIPQSTIHGLNALGEKVETLIAGGFDRGLDYTDLGVFLANRKGLKTLILFPDTGEKIWLAIITAAARQKLPLHLKKFAVSSMKQAVAVAFRQTSSGKICLLSPAAASYNLFKNFEDRGNEFKKQITASPPARLAEVRQPADEGGPVGLSTAPPPANPSPRLSIGRKMGSS